MSSINDSAAAPLFRVPTPPDPASLLADAQRIAAVHDTQLLDTAPEEVFDRLTLLSARLLDVPVAFLSLVDSDRDYHKSRSVFGQAQTTDLVMRGRTFCHYTMVSQTPVVINDATQYPVYRDIATVREQGVRAFAGIPLTTPEGKRIGTFCVVDFQPKDWTERDLETLSELARAALREINMRQALRRSEENALSARNAMRAREEVLAIVAHDLRSPLAVIQMSAEALQMSPQFSDDNKAVERMQRAAKSMQDLVTDLLEVSKIRQGRAVSRLSRVAPDELLRDAVQMMLPIADRAGISLVNTAQPGPRDVMIDYERILRVLSNLVGNAIKFSPKGSTVVLHALHERDDVKFSVTDNGVGIDIAERVHMFDKFWQGSRNTAAANAGGAGLGLSIAKEIVEAHSGKIGVEETADPGSSFYFVLPTS